MKKEWYLSVDIEADGRIPGDNSMLSLGAVCFDSNGNERSHFYEKLFPLNGASADKDTMDWWESQPAAWAEVTTNQKRPSEVMRAFDVWMRDWNHQLNCKPVFVGYPASYDFLFVYWYLIHFVGRAEFSFSALDLKSYAMAKLGTTFKGSTKRHMPKRWFGKGKHSHIAVEDAREQGELWFKMRDDDK